MLLGVMTVLGMCKLACGKNKKVSDDHRVEFAAESMKSFFIVQYLSAERVFTFSVVLYCSR